MTRGAHEPRVRLGPMQEVLRGLAHPVPFILVKDSRELALSVPQLCSALLLIVVELTWWSRREDRRSDQGVSEAFPGPRAGKGAAYRAEFSGRRLQSGFSRGTGRIFGRAPFTGRIFGKAPFTERIFGRAPFYRADFLHLLQKLYWILKMRVSRPFLQQIRSEPAFPGLPCTWNARNPLFCSAFRLGSPYFCRTRRLDAHNPRFRPLVEQICSESAFPGLAAQNAGFQTIFATNPLRTRVSRPSM